MRVHYFHAPDGNFGDDLNAWIWQSLIPDAIGIDDELVMVGIGTLLNRGASDRYPEARRWAAMGSGAGYGLPPRGLDRDGSRHITVRGPLTAHVLGMAAERAVTDGAILLAGLPIGAPLPAGERGGVVMMPHHSGPDLPLWRAACARAGVTYLDPTADSVAIIRALRRARLVLADAMHAAIVSDTLRVPWVPLVSYAGISMFKWLDWTLSMGLPYEPVMLATSARTRRRDHALRSRGFVETFDDHTFDGAARHYAEGARRRADWRERAGRRIKRTAHMAVRRWQAPTTTTDAEIERAAGQLRVLSNHAGYLSDERLFGQRLATMQERLGEVERLARAGR